MFSLFYNKFTGIGGQQYIKTYMKTFIYKKIIVKEYEKWIYEKLSPTKICYCCVQLPFFDDFDEDVECRFLKCNFPH